MRVETHARLGVVVGGDSSTHLLPGGEDGAGSRGGGEGGADGGGGGLDDGLERGGEGGDLVDGFILVCFESNLPSK